MPLRTARPLPQWLLSVALACWSKRGQWQACRPTRRACACWLRCACKTANRPKLAELGRERWPPHDAGEFTRWVKDVLEAGRYVAAQSAEAPVVVLPMPQLLEPPACRRCCCRAAMKSACSRA